jgi:ATP/maltotriose-dependent transcriptional regulator MalT
MLYGAHVFARAKEIPDLALERGQQSYDWARANGDGALEFLSAIGMAHVELGLRDVDEAERWLLRASARASATPTPHKARLVATVTALIAGERGDTGQMVAGLREVASMASAQRRPAAQSEALALLALEAARRGAEAHDDDLLSAAEAAARDARRLASQTTGQPPWVAQADAAEARIALARGDVDTALARARDALSWLQQSFRDDPHLEILLPAGRALLAAGSDEEKQFIGQMLQVYQAVGVSRVMDDRIRVRWFRGPLGRELSELAGPIERTTAEPKGAEAGHPQLDEDDTALLRLLVQGMSNREIGEQLGVDDTSVAGKLSALYAHLGTSSRAETTAFAFRAV